MEDTEQNAVDGNALRLKIKFPGANLESTPGGGSEDSRSSLDNKLKIVIKKSDLTSTPNPSGSSSGTVSLSFVSFPKLSSPLSVFSKFVASGTSDKLDEARESELLQLTEELEQMRSSLREFSVSLQTQLDRLENWKSTNPQAPMIASHKGPKQSQTQDESDLLDLSEEEEEELEVAEGEAVSSGLPGSGKGGKLKKGAKNKTAMMLRKKNIQGKKNKAKGLRSSKLNATASVRKKAPTSSEEDSDEESLYKYKGMKNNFWADMEPFFASFTDQDVAFCIEQKIEGDQAFSIPPLGRNYREVWEEEDNDEVESVPVSNVQDGSLEGPNGERSVTCGDLTQRMLAALIGENPSPSINQLSSGPQKEWKSYLASGEASLSLSAPPTFDYSHEAMLSLEERIKMELRSIGLLDDHLDFDTGQREDDEICSELRKLQRQLKDQISSNNSIRNLLFPVVTQHLTREHERVKQQQQAANLEKAYWKTVKKKRKIATH